MAGFTFFLKLLLVPYFSSQSPLPSSSEGLLYHLALACRTLLTGPPLVPRSEGDLDNDKHSGYTQLGSSGHFVKGLVLSVSLAEICLVEIVPMKGNYGVPLKLIAGPAPSITQCRAYYVGFQTLWHSHAGPRETWFLEYFKLWPIKLARSCLRAQLLKGWRKHIWWGEAGALFPTSFLQCF